MSVDKSIGTESRDQPSELVLEPPAATALRGRVTNAPSTTLVSALQNDQPVAVAILGGMGEFTLSLPRELVDGELHHVLIQTGVTEPRSLNVILDPKLVGGKRSELQPLTPGGVPVRPGERLQSALGPVNTPGEELTEQVLDVMVEGSRAQTKALEALLQSVSSHSARARGPFGAKNIPQDPTRLYGHYFHDAIRRPGSGRDVICLGVIDWDFRIQRPQHLVAGLAGLGWRAFYVSIVFAPANDRGRFEIIRMPATGVFEVRLNLTSSIPANIYSGFTEDQVQAIIEALNEMSSVLSLSEPVVIVQFPAWHPVAAGLQGATVVHDCLDLVSGFKNVASTMVTLEGELVKSADLVVTTSTPLRDHLADVRDSTVIRNGADIGFFRAAAAVGQRPAGRRPVVGYFGAIAHWFQVDWVAQAAKHRPQWDFVLIGSTDGADVAPLRELSNVNLMGEKPYAALPGYLAEFDVAIIPFKLLDLILCTNPVKLYEYMAAGKPVVASAMPEVVAATELVYIARDADDFELQLERAILDDSEALQRSRMSWSEQHSWGARAVAFQDAVEGLRCKVSVVVLSFNNWSFTSATLWSLLNFSDYANLEIIVVDNGSTDGSPGRLREFERRDGRIKLILSEKNLGYAGGNNLGLRAATGDYIVLLNNDTYVTRGWVHDLIRPLRLQPDVGLVSPLTNNIGNEQRVEISYSDMQEMAREARKVVARFRHNRFETDSVAFFCVAMRRELLEKIGYLDEIYGVGFFEDDDYCRRTRAAGYRIQIVDGVFVHHHLSASFDDLGSEVKRAQMERNKAIFEERWGEWRPHTYRTAPGFGPGKPPAGTSSR